MPVDSMIQRLWDLGHFKNPAKPTGVTEAELPLLQLHDPRVKLAVASFQEVMGAEPTGKIEDAIAQKVFEIERCGCPDYGPDVEMATGSGSWPAGCHQDWPNNHTFTINMIKNGMPSFLGSKTDPNSICEQAFELCRQAYADMGIVFIRQDGNTRANTQVTWQRGAGWIGLAIVGQNQRCGSVIWAKFDNVYKPSALLDQWARLFAHEFGHNMGMSHSRGGIMNPSIVSGKFTRTAWRGDPSESTLKRWFGGVPIDLGGGPTDPPDPPPTGEIKVDGTVFINGRPYVLVPKVEV